MHSWCTAVPEHDKRAEVLEWDVTAMNEIADGTGRCGTGAAKHLHANGTILRRVSARGRGRSFLRRGRMLHREWRKTRCCPETAFLR